MKAIDIDVGGTFTDLVLTWDDAADHVAKAPTTPYDLSVGFLDVLNAGAEQLGRPLDEVLPRGRDRPVLDDRRDEPADRAQGPAARPDHDRGPRGRDPHRPRRAVDRRHARSASAGTSRCRTKPTPLVERDMIVGVRERIDSTGRVLRPLDEDDVRDKLRHARRQRRPGDRRLAAVVVRQPRPRAAGSGRSSARSTRATTSATCRWSCPTRSSARSASTSGR